MGEPLMPSIILPAHDDSVGELSPTAIGLGGSFEDGVEFADLPSILAAPAQPDSPVLKTAPPATHRSRSLRDLASGVHDQSILSSPSSSPADSVRRRKEEARVELDRKQKEILELCALDSPRGVLAGKTRDEAQVLVLQSMEIGRSSVSSLTEVIKAKESELEARKFEYSDRRRGLIEKRKELLEQEMKLKQLEYLKRLEEEEQMLAQKTESTLKLSESINEKIKNKSLLIELLQSGSNSVLASSSSSGTITPHVTSSPSPPLLARLLSQPPHPPGRPPHIPKQPEVFSIASPVRDLRMPEDQVYVDSPASDDMRSPDLQEWEEHDSAFSARSHSTEGQMVSLMAHSDGYDEHMAGLIGHPDGYQEDMSSPIGQSGIAPIEQSVDQLGSFSPQSAGFEDQIVSSLADSVGYDSPPTRMTVDMSPVSMIQYSPPEDSMLNTLLPSPGIPMPVSDDITVMSPDIEPRPASSGKLVLVEMPKLFAAEPSPDVSDKDECKAGSIVPPIGEFDDSDGEAKSAVYAEPEVPNRDAIATPELVDWSGDEVQVMLDEPTQISALIVSLEDDPPVLVPAAPEQVPPLVQAEEAAALERVIERVSDSLIDSLVDSVIADHFVTLQEDKAGTHPDQVVLPAAPPARKIPMRVDSFDLSFTDVSLNRSALLVDVEAVLATLSTAVRISVPVNPADELGDAQIRAIKAVSVQGRLTDACGLSRSMAMCISDSFHSLFDQLPPAAAADRSWAMRYPGSRNPRSAFLPTRHSMQSILAQVNTLLIEAFTPVAEPSNRIDGICRDFLGKFNLEEAALRSDSAECASAEAEIIDEVNDFILEAVITSVSNDFDLAALLRQPVLSS